MKCPYCGYTDTDVLETRDSEDLAVTRRRRSCDTCKKRFTTYERIETTPLTVMKRDLRREPFDRDKLSRGIWRASGKTMLKAEDVRRIVDEVERVNWRKYNRGIKQEDWRVGRETIKKIDKIAYIRFASVLRHFVIGRLSGGITKINKKK